MKTRVSTCVLCAISALAYGAEFPDPATPAAVVDVPGVYTATGDLTYSTFKIGSNAAAGTSVGEYVFDLTNGGGSPYTVTLTGPGNGVMSFYSPAGVTQLSTAILRGGTWNFTGSAPFFNSEGSYGPWRTLVLDGAAMTGSNLAFYYGKNADTDLRIVLTNGASLTAKTLNLTGYTGAYRASMEVMSGSAVSVSGNVLTDGGNNETALGVRIIVDGAGSSFATTGNTTIGAGHEDVRLEVLNGATYDANGKGVSIANGKFAADDHLVVSNGASLVCGTFSLGSWSSENNTAVHDNSARILDGATVTVNGKAYIGCAYQTAGSSNNLFEVRNANFTCTDQLMVHGSNCTDNVARFVGAGSAISLGSNFKAFVTRSTRTGGIDMGVGSRNVLEFDGVVWNHPQNFRIGEGIECEVRVINGSAVDFGDKTFCVGPQDATYAYHGNLLYVGSGASVSAKTIQLTGDGDRMVVSNGTVNATRTDTAWNSAGLMLSYIEENYGYRGTNNVLTLQGDSPLVKSAGTIVFRSNLRVAFDIPASGYAANHVPVQAPVFRFDFGKPVLVPNVEAFRESLTAKTSITLMQATTSLTPSTVIEDSNAVAPEGCTWSLGQDNLSIVLTVKPPKKGFTLIIL